METNNQHQTSHTNINSEGNISVKGIFEPQSNKSGQLLDPARNGRKRASDPFLPQELIRRFKVRRGSHIVGQGQQDRRFQNPKVRYIDTIDNLSVENRRKSIEFTQLTTITPDKWLKLETKDGNMTVRAMDIFCPIGKETCGGGSWRPGQMVSSAPSRRGSSRLTGL